jgi:hypothetical protein
MMKEYVRRVMGFEENNIIYVEDAPLSKLNEIFGTERAPKGRLYKYLKPQVSRVFIYYGGHGAPDLESGHAFFVPVDGNPEYIRASGYRLQTFYDNLSKLPAKKITVVLDACFSGNTDKGVLFKGISPAMVKVRKEYRGPAGRGADDQRLRRSGVGLVSGKTPFAVYLLLPQRDAGRGGP